ncbi:hypothetical protein R3P38DRAFT_3222519 [Favolaschia claudopus]|uniref:F-box domain-containing protein n=1 Tax=Favolaschia claudopus TaxID=2862362 RepID=A0AAV9ZYZ7_9AGAR
MSAAAVHKLPNELLAFIFTLLLWDLAALKLPSHRRVLATVCKSWLHQVVHTPTLWRRIPLHACVTINHIQFCLTRSNGVDLEVDIRSWGPDVVDDLDEGKRKTRSRGSYGFATFVGTFLLQHLSRIRTLSIAFTQSYDLSMVLRSVHESSAPLLTNLRLQIGEVQSWSSAHKERLPVHWVSLKLLDLSGVGGDWFHAAQGVHLTCLLFRGIRCNDMTVDQILDVLDTLQALQTLEYTHVHCLGDVSPADRVTELKYLTQLSICLYDSDGVEVFRHLRLPALVDIHFLQYTTICIEPLLLACVDFLRKSPRVQVQFGDHPYGDFDTLWTNICEVVHLDLGNSDSTVWEHLKDFLWRDNHRQHFTQLHTLVIPLIVTIEEAKDITQQLQSQGLPPVCLYAKTNSGVQKMPDWREWMIQDNEVTFISPAFFPTFDWDVVEGSPHGWWK